ncbi:MAG: DUF5050 domain-containing protein, partial [Oscillospiraceae bacterium]|nr:DUF5050 domain-containing protein [Oscillospiraceae bacterium]
AKSYIIYLFDKKSQRFNKFGEITGTSCLVKKLQPDTEYIYKVRAKFDDGSMGDFSQPASIYTYNSIGRMPCNFFAASQGEWIYFSSGYDGYRNETDVKYTLSKIKSDGSELMKISDDYATDINVAGEYIYYYDCKTGCIKKININGSGEQILLEEQDYAPNEIIVYGDMIYYLLYDSAHEEAAGFYDVCAMKTDGTDNRYICTLGEEVYSRFIGVYNGMVCFGYNNINVILDDDGFHTENTGEYIIKGFKGYECRDICRFKNITPSYTEITDEGFYYSSGKSIVKYDFKNKKTYRQSIPAYHFKITENGIVYTVYEKYEKNMRTVRVVSEGKETSYFENDVGNFSLFESYAAILDDNGEIGIIYY